MHYDPDERAYSEPEIVCLERPLSWRWAWVAVVLALGCLFL